MTRSFVEHVARCTWVAVLLVAAVGAGCSSSTTSCPAGQTACNGVCVDLQTDALHCGTCSTSCIAGASCNAGLCACPAAQPDTCGIQCVNKQTATANCGTCGHDCGLGTCQAASCVCSAPPVALCPSDPATGTCLDTSTNASNCGACGNVCIAGEVCTASACVCASPKQVCGSGTAAVCTNTSTDPRNCGACGTACAAGQTCSGGTCQQTCTAGLTLCSGACVDLKTDPAHCGACATSCLLGQSCSAGTCQATCTTLTCGGTCCQAGKTGNSCCPPGGSGTSCPSLHKNFVGTASEQSYFDCTPSFTYDVVTAETAARNWAPNGNRITTTLACPIAGGGSLCLVWQKPILATDQGCGVWCYSGPFAGTLSVTQTTACPCPTALGTDWF
jgi:hypothetical protein